MNIYQFESYKVFLQSYFSQEGKRGDKTKLAEHLNCQTSFISQVLTGDKTHFSLEHINQICQYLKLDLAQTDYLILLCSHERAGTKELKEYFYNKIIDTKNEYQKISSKILKRGKTLTNEQKATYYGHWAYMAIHMIVSIPEFATAEKIKKYFYLPEEFVKEVLDFLINAELIEREHNQYRIGKTRIHLESTSPFVRAMHTNWRQKAIESLVKKAELDLHYSSVLVLSHGDALKIKHLILDLIKEKEKILLPSPEEQLVVFNLDFFEI